MKLSTLEALGTNSSGYMFTSATAANYNFHEVVLSNVKCQLDNALLVTAVKRSHALLCPCQSSQFAAATCVKFRYLNSLFCFFFFLLEFKLLRCVQWPTQEILIWRLNSYRWIFNRFYLFFQYFLTLSIVTILSPLFYVGVLHNSFVLRNI